MDILRRVPRFFAVRAKAARGKHVIDGESELRQVEARSKAMNHSRSYPQVMRRRSRPIEQECPQCHRRLREAMTLTRRTVITLEGVIKLTHAGYRCPDVDCPGHQRTYRSPVADALALPHFTFGLDSVLRVGTAAFRQASDGR